MLYSLQTDNVAKYSSPHIVRYMCMRRLRKVTGNSHVNQSVLRFKPGIYEARVITTRLQCLLDCGQQVKFIEDELSLDILYKTLQSMREVW
jgi:hypothetical protein